MQTNEFGLPILQRRVIRRIIFHIRDNREHLLEPKYRELAPVIKDHFVGLLSGPLSMEDFTFKWDLVPDDKAEDPYEMMFFFEWKKWLADWELAHGDDIPPPCFTRQGAIGQ